MKRNRIKSWKSVIFLYAISSSVFFFSFAGYCSIDEKNASVALAWEKAILALSDPFVVKIMKMPEPEPVKVIAPVEPVVVPVVVESTPEPVVILAPDLSLTGIIYNSMRSMAIINGEIVEQGDTIVCAEGKARIMRIEKTKVTIQYMNEAFSYTTDPGE